VENSLYSFCPQLESWGGKIIQDIQAETGSTIVIEEVDDEGIVDIVSADKASIEAAKERIRSIIAIPEAGEVYTGKVQSITAFGAFIEIMPGKEGLLHISELEWKNTKDVEDVIKSGEEVEVKLIEVDPKTGKMKLSRRALIEKPADYVESRPPRRDNRNDRGGRGGGNDRRRDNRGGNSNRRSDR